MHSHSCQTFLIILCFAGLAVLFPLVLLAEAEIQADAQNHSYTTFCAEVDNIDVPVFCTNVTAYRVTAYNPRYNPTSINESGADWDDCTTEFSSDIWEIGTSDSSSAEFRTSGFSRGDVYYAEDAPSEGIDESATNFPREINNDWMYDQYIRFTTAMQGDSDNDRIFGSKFTVRMHAVSGTVEIRVHTATTNGTWTNQGTRTFTSSSLQQDWDIPDLTWMAGTDTNVIHLDVVRSDEGGATTTNSWAYYDWLQLRQRDFRGANGGNAPVLYTNADMVIDAVWEDKWVNHPEEMQIEVVGGSSISTSQYLRIKQRLPNTSEFRETFVLYQNAYARIKPFCPTNLGDVPYGASVILGPTTNALRPGAHIDKVTVDPIDLSLDIDYLDGSAAHVELRCDREAHVVDVTGITYDVVTNACTRLRSMWVHDGKSDLDRMDCAEGMFSIMKNWSAVDGSWWHFYREVPSYHNTYCPEYRVEIMSPSPAYYFSEAESNAWGSNCWISSVRTNASNDQTLIISPTGGQARFDMTLTEDQQSSYLRLHYAVEDGGNGIDDLANTIHAVVDGTYTSPATYAVHTGGTNEYEILPSIYLGDLAAGAHELMVVCGSGTNGLELDSLSLVSQPSQGWINRSIVLRQGEDYDDETNTVVMTRSGAVYGDSLHMEDSVEGGEAVYDVFVSNACSNVFLRVRYADDVGPNKCQVYWDNDLRLKFPTEDTGYWDDFVNSPVLFFGDVATGWHQVAFVCDEATWGMDLDEFELYELADNSAPSLIIPGPHQLPVGSWTNFEVVVDDPDGDTGAVFNTVSVDGATFITNWFEWQAGSSYAGSTSMLMFVVDDQRGLSNSITTHGTSIVVPFDWDVDGLGDGWEWTSFTSLLYVATDDNDDDGSDNLTELIAGTDATRADSVFTVTEVQAEQDSTNHYITISTEPGRRYTIEFTDGLSDVISWSLFADADRGTWTETNEVSAIYTFHDDEGSDTSGGAPLEGTRYYRAKVSTP